MTTNEEQNGAAAKVRLTRDYETCIDEMLAGVDPENFYLTLDGERVDEYTLMGRLMVRAGVAWTCLDHKCRCINVQKNLSCDSCGRRRASKRSIPQPDSWA